jgi:hypothetical protein
MQGDVQDEIAAHLLTTAQGITIAAGYDLPEDFKLVTDELLMWDSTGGKYPALILQVEGKSAEPIEFTYGHEGRLPFRYIVYFQVPTVVAPATVTPMRPASYARRYVSAIERAYMQDITRGGLADWTEIDDTHNALVWRDNGVSTVFEATVRGLVVYEYNPQQA